MRTWWKSGSGVGLISHSRRETDWLLARLSKLCEDSIEKQTDKKPHKTYIIGFLHKWVKVSEEWERHRASQKIEAKQGCGLSSHLNLKPLRNWCKKGGLSSSMAVSYWPLAEVVSRGMGCSWSISGSDGPLWDNGSCLEKRTAVNYQPAPMADVSREFSLAPIISAIWPYS